MFGEFVQSANSPNIFLMHYSVPPGGGEPLPYGKTPRDSVTAVTAFRDRVLAVTRHGEHQGTGKRVVEDADPYGREPSFHRSSDS